MTNADKIRIIARYTVFLENTAKDLGMLSGDVLKVIKEYHNFRKKILGK